MIEMIASETPSPNLFGSAHASELFAGLDPETDEGRAELAAIARKIASTRRPGAKSDIPAGVTYLTQLVVLDLGFPTRDHADGGPLLDLGLVYGDGPKHNACCYQVPFQAGMPRHLLRIGRTRPTASSPAWGATRDLPRTSCPNLDARPVESRSEVLVPNSASDSNLLLAQLQVLWALMHNAVAATLSDTRRPEVAFDLARRVNRRIYRQVVQSDVLGAWLLPAFRENYVRAQTADAVHMARPPVEFTAGVGRLGHGLVRESYSLNDRIQVAGLRTLLRHTSTGRPFEMPLTEDWLLDFSRFFRIGSSVPQRARALGPHVARPLATSAVAPADGSNEGLVLRDLLGCTQGGVRSVRSLIALAMQADRHPFEGWFAQDETRWQRTLAEWLADTGLSEEAIERLSQDPPLTLFLMLEAEADAGGKSLGALGSVIMGETLAAALGAEIADPDTDAASALVFRGEAPANMSDMIRFLQKHYRFAEGARLHALEEVEPRGSTGSSPDVSGGLDMLDVNVPNRHSIPRIEVADYIEMGRLVAQWSADPATRPTNIQDLRDQLDGIAIVPDRVKTVEFAQSSLDHLVLHLPVKEMIEESIECMSDPMGDGRYPLPQFYADHYRPGFGPVMTPLDTLLARVGDHTIAQSR